MILDGVGWHYLAVKKQPALLRGITSKHHGDFYGLNCLQLFATESKREYHKEVGENKDFCNVIMLSEYTKILEFNQYQKSDKAPFIVYTYLECLIEKTDGCKNNLDISFTTKVGEKIPSSFSMSTISSFKSIKNKHDLYRGNNCMKTFSESLRDHTMKMINFK